MISAMLHTTDSFVAWMFACNAEPLIVGPGRDLGSNFTAISGVFEFGYLPTHLLAEPPRHSFLYDALDIINRHAWRSPTLMRIGQCRR